MLFRYSLTSGSSISPFWSRSCLATMAPYCSSSSFDTMACAGLPRSGSSELADEEGGECGASATATVVAVAAAVRNTSSSERII